MKKKNLLAIVLLLLVTNAMSYFIGSNTIYMAKDCHKDGTESIWYPHFFNTEDALIHERQYCSAWIELAHYYLYDNNPSMCSECNDSTDIERERNNYWLDVVSESDYYEKIDSLNGGDWEDFYENWTK